MRRIMVALFALVFTALAANVKLYLKDGTFHLVREYQVQGDRVHFYSVERSQWEDVPLELVDLKRTEGEVADRKAQVDEEVKVVAQEEKAKRDMRAELAKIPRDPGVYYMDGKTVVPIPVGESKVHTDKRREVLKYLSPIPMVSGKATVELDGEHSKNIITNPEQEFYIQLFEEERFGIIKLTPGKGIRLVEKMSVVPISKEIIEEAIDVQVFRKQMTEDGLYKLWPIKPLEPGEYAVVENTPGKTNMQVWDFAVPVAERK